MPEEITLRHFLHLRPGIGNCHKVAARLIRSHSLLRKLEEILLENIGFESAARFAGNDEKRSGNVDLFLESFHLRGICRIENVQVRIAGNLAEGLSQNFRTQARSSHAEQKSVLETRAPDFLGKIP